MHVLPVLSFGPDSCFGADGMMPVSVLSIVACCLHCCTVYLTYDVLLCATGGWFFRAHVLKFIQLYYEKVFGMRASVSLSGAAILVCICFSLYASHHDVVLV